VTDAALDQVHAWFLKEGDLRARFGRCFRAAIDELIDCKRTGRYCLEQLNAQEKAFIGVKVETVVRGEFGFPYRAHGKDFQIAEQEVDCKWSIFLGRWTIPREQVGHLCLGLWADDNRGDLAVALLRTTEDILNAGENRDGKRTIRASALADAVTWLVEPGPGLPPNFLLGLDDGDRTAILGQPGGVRRLLELYTRCEGVIISRHTMAAIGQQMDDARRARGGASGVRDELAALGLELLNGTFLDQRARAEALGGPVPGRGETVCLRSDGTTAARLQARRGS
jgi:hypothetical protein